MTEKRTRGAPCSFKCKQGLQEGNVRGAKLTEKRTRDAPCSFKCKQGLQGRKHQGSQIDGEKENKSLNCQTYFPFGLKIRIVEFLNSIIMTLVSLTFLLYPLRLGSAILKVIGEKASDTVLTNGKRSKYCAPSSPLPQKSRADHLRLIEFKWRNL